LAFRRLALPSTIAGTTLFADFRIDNLVRSSGKAMAAQTAVHIESTAFGWRGLVGGALLIGSAATVVGSAPLVELTLVVRAALTALGWAMLAVGVGFRFWATLYVGGRKVGGHHEPRLTVDGPYSVVRNPLYVGSLAIGLSAPLLLHSAVLLGAVLLAVLHYAWSVVPAEETFLRRAVGDGAYDAYAARTPRWLPNFRLFQSPRDHEFDAKAVRKEFYRAARLLAAAVAMTLLAAARFESWWPATFRLP
jgi:protein-S-isoprenylcysteine O-methyltransferase Ste14